VHSINTSGHKFGLVYVGIGWVLWKDESFLPKDLIFELHYLGSTEYSYTLNFSRPAAPILGQMFNFLNLGFEGYRKVAWKDLKNARMLSRALDATYFKVLSNIHVPKTDTLANKAVQAVSGDVDLEDPEYYQPGLPVVSFRLSDEFQKEYPHVKQLWIQTLLRGKGWIIPNYAAPEKVQHIDMLRIVVRETMTGDLVERVLTDILEVTESLMADTSVVTMLASVSAPKAGIHHAEIEHSRPQGKDEGDEGKTQNTFAKQC